MKLSILISGAGVAGLASAYWLTRFGFDCTVLERASSLRDGGQAVDVRGAALDVLRAMGIEPAVRARRTRLRGSSIIDRNGRELRRNEGWTLSGGRLDSDDIEVFRDDLCALLAGALGARAELRFGESIGALGNDAHGATAIFGSAERRRYDLVIGADGVFSQVRRLALDAGDACLQPLGVAMALFTAPNALGLSHWEWIYREEALGVVAYTTNDNGELRVGAGFASDPENVLPGDVAAQRAYALAQCGSLGGRLGELVGSLQQASRFYYGDLAQVHLPSWSSGHVTLVGDAAYCASPFSGQGTSMALVGGFVLARELARTPADIAGACARYEQRMRPYVEVNQALVDVTREGPVPEAQMDRAKHGIVLDDLPEPARASGPQPA